MGMLTQCVMLDSTHQGTATFFRRGDHSCFSSSCPWSGCSGGSQRTERLVGSSAPRRSLKGLINNTHQGCRHRPVNETIAIWKIIKNMVFPSLPYHCRFNDSFFPRQLIAHVPDLWGVGPPSLFTLGYPVVPAFISETLLSQLNSLLSLSKTSGLNVRIYFWTQLYSTALMDMCILRPVPYCHDYCSFEISFETGKCESSNFIFQAKEVYG